MSRKARRARGGMPPKRRGAPDPLLAEAVRRHQAGRLDEAGALYRRLLEARPGHAGALHYLGVLALQRGRPAEAVDLITAAAARRPGDAAMQYNLGNALQASGRLEAAAGAFRRAVALAPAEADAHVNLGNVLQALGHRREAEAAYRKAIAIAPNLAEAHSNLGGLLHLRGRLEEAEAAYRKALELKPRYPDAHNNLGNVMKAEGRIEEAVAAYQQALRLNPGLAEAASNVAALKDFAPDDPLIASLERLRETRPVALGDAIHVRFALAQIYAKLDRHDDAFAAYREANKLRKEQDRRAGRPFDAAEHGRYVDSLIAFFTPEFFATRRGFGADSEVPVFILGMPRSGTTLVEQIVSSHPKVHGAGELDDLGEVISRARAPAGAERRYPQRLAALDEPSARRLGEAYVERLRAHASEPAPADGPGAARITDKMPTNFQHIGAIALLLPRARIIHCIRDPLDVCLSCFLMNFQTGNTFANDLEDLGLYYRRYERLMAHWRAAAPVAMLDVRYEDLIEHQEDVTRRIIAFLGLDWDERCLRFHENPRAVTTASNVQVRQRIYRGAMGRWRTYAAHLGPLRQALGDAAGRA